MPIYMEYEGLTGDVTASGHENWIDITSVQWGSSRAIASSGDAHNRTKSAAQVREVVLTREQDSASGKILNEHFSNTSKAVKFDWTTTSQASEICFLRLELKHAQVSSYSISGHASDRPMEQFSLNFTDITWTFFAKEKEGTKASKPFVVNYNLAARG